MTAHIMLALFAANAPRTEVMREDRLASFLCELQPRLRWKRGKRWTKRECDEAAQAYVANSQDLDVRDNVDQSVHDLLAVAVSIQESDLVDGAKSPDGNDFGLMGLRVTGRMARRLKRTDLVKISVNIQIGMNELRELKHAVYWQTYVTEYRDKNGRPTFKAVRKPCDHTKHASWTHYNNGIKISEDKFKASYGDRVAALYLALCERFGERPRELLTKRPRTNCKRTRELVQVITDMPWQDPAETPKIAEQLFD